MKEKTLSEKREELFDSFERVEQISEVLILGVGGGIRRIQKWIE